MEPLYSQWDFTAGKYHVKPGDWHHWLFGFLPFWTAWDAGILLQFFIAGLGMIILLKSRGIPIPYVLLGAVSFSFYSQFIMWIYDRWLGGIIWAPLIVWSLLEGRRKNKWVHLPSILFIALGFRGGHLQACLLCFSFGAVRVSCGLVETGRPLVLESFSEIIIFLFDLRIFGGVAFLGCFCGHPAAHGRL